MDVSCTISSGSRILILVFQCRLKTIVRVDSFLPRKMNAWFIQGLDATLSWRIIYTASREIIYASNLFITHHVFYTCTCYIFLCFRLTVIKLLKVRSEERKKTIYISLIIKLLLKKKINAFHHQLHTPITFSDEGSVIIDTRILQIKNYVAIFLFFVTTIYIYIFPRGVNVLPDRC